MKGAAQIFAFLIDAAARGERTALVTLTDVIGSSSRAPGTHMAVSETGAFAGSFSGGCVEAAVVAEAQRIIAGGLAARLRFGAGSPFLDIRLPCGGGIDLLFAPDPAPAAIAQAATLLAARRGIVLHVDQAGGITVAREDAHRRSEWEGDLFAARHRPDLRIVALGHGAEAPALARLGAAYGAHMLVLSPDTAIVDAVAAAGGRAERLKTPERSVHLVTDADTAAVFLFHDHDWEPALLAQALEQETLYVGAMGSRRTHAARLEALAAIGVPAAAAARIVAPIGLIPATRDPDTLALSVLAQIVERVQD